MLHAHKGPVAGDRKGYALEWGTAGCVLAAAGRPDLIGGQAGFLATRT